MATARSAHTVWSGNLTGEQPVTWPSRAST